MFDYIAVENLDPRLITVTSGGKIQTDQFADTLFLKSLMGQNNVFSSAVGDIVFTSTDPSLSIINQSGTIYFSSSYERTLVSSIWSASNYLSDTVALNSDEGFTCSSVSTGVLLSPNAVHSLNTKVGDLSLFGLGNLSLFTDTEQNSLNLSVLKIDDTNIDINSNILAGKIQAEVGVSLARDLMPDFTHFGNTSNLLSIQGLSGVVLEKPTIGQVTASKVSLSATGAIFSNSGQLVFSGATSVSVVSGTHLGPVHLSAYCSGSFTNYTHLGSGVYTQSIPLARYPLSLDISFNNTNTGFGQDFTKVLSYVERDAYNQQLVAINSGISSKFISLMDNPDSLSGTTLTDYRAMLTDLMANYIVLTDFGTPYSSLTGSIGLYPSKSAVYLPIITGILSSGTVSILTNFTSDKLDLGEVNTLLSKPNTLAYYYELQNPSGSSTTNLVLFLKSPTQSPPSGAFLGIFAT